MDVYGKVIDAYSFPLLVGGNLQSPALGSQMNYLVAAIEQPSFVKYEAEAVCLSGAVSASNQPGYSGSGFANLLTIRETTLSGLSMPHTQGRTLAFTAANGGTTTRSFEVKVDGVAKQTVSIPASGSWQTWRTTTGPTVLSGCSQNSCNNGGPSGP